ncbi:MAG: WD40/YVTN/BNR-like repeat-containing protein [Planctomycetota bacterium]|jgi:photosystem II stability/assembly factor-like uncharacterized protein
MAVTLVVGTDRGAFICRSDAARTSWQVDGPHFKGWKVTASARTRSGRYLVATASRVYGAALHVSDDFERWHQVEQGPAYPEGGGKKLHQFWTLKAAGKRTYAGADTAGLFLTEDEGETWHPLPGLNDHPTSRSWYPGAGGLCAHVVLVDPRNPARVWCGISAVGAWRSEDHGETWHAKNEGVRYTMEDEEFKEIGFCIHGLAADPGDADRIWRQDHTGMYRTRDGGDTWEPCGHGLASPFGFPIAIDPATKRLFAFPLESDEYRMPVDGRFRIYRSTSGGDAWEEAAEGLPSGPTYAGVLRGAMAVDGLQPGGIYAGSTAGVVYASADGGDRWEPLPWTLPRILSVEAYADG